jgi:two-component system sensor histidine kinase KdpD
LRALAAVAAVASLTFVCVRIVPVNATTVGFVYLVAVLIVATVGGLAEATIASLVAMLLFNYYFLPPVGTLTIADPQNWVALFAFLATSIVASHLSARARQRAREAVDRQHDMERLYALSRSILLTRPDQSVARQIAFEIAQVFEFDAVMLFDRNSGEIHRAGPEDLPGIEPRLREAATQGTLFRDGATGTVVTAVRLGGEPIGSLAVCGVWPSDTVLQGLANLAAIGLERARAQDAANRAEAARQSQELKSALLDAVAHEFKTPLTSMKAATSALLSDTVGQGPEQRELLTVVDEEIDHLNQLVTEAIQMARIEAGSIQLHRQAHAVGEMIAAVIGRMKTAAGEKIIHAQLEQGLPPVEVDRSLMELALRQLVDNALRYSAPKFPVWIGARRDGSTIVVSIRDRGPGIPSGEQSRIFEKFYRGSNARRTRGTGMGLAIAREIARAHGGDVRLERTGAEGSEFSLIIPLAESEVSP